MFSFIAHETGFKFHAQPKPQNLTALAHYILVTSYSLYTAVIRGFYHQLGDQVHAHPKTAHISSPDQ